MSISERKKETLPVGFASTPETPFLIDLFSAFNKSNICYCVLRNYEGLPYDLQGSDIDILVSKELIDSATQLVITVANKHKGFAVWREWNDFLNVVLCSGICDNGIIWGVHICFFTAIRWKGLDYYSSDQVLLRATNKDGIIVADALDASLSSFLKDVLYTKDVRKDYFLAVKTVYRLDTDTIKKQIASTFGKVAESLILILESQDSGLVINFVPKIRRGLLIRQLSRYPLKVLKNKLVCFKVHCQRLFYRSGIFVAVLGLDGAGKTTLIELVRDDIERLLHSNTEHCHFRPGLLPSLAKLAGLSSEEIGPVTNPHAKPPSGLFFSFFRLAYYTLDYAIGFWLSVYPKLFRNPTVVFFDRYFYEYFVDPARSRVSAPWWIVRMFGWFVPQPDLVVMLKPNPEVFYKRKPELPLEVLRRQGERMYKLAGKLKHVVWIDTSSEIEFSRKEMVQKILNTFRRRSGWK